MPAPFPEEFKQRPIALIREEGHPVAQVARELGIAESGFVAGWRSTTWTGQGEGLTSNERKELSGAPP